MRSDFVSQTILNGTGSSSNFGYIKPYNTTYLGLRQCELPSGAIPNGSNTFVQVNSVTGSCNSTLYSGSSLATSPSPTSRSTFNCADQVLLMSTGGQAQSIRSVQDSCAACSGQFNGANGHIDAFNTTSQSCNPHSFPDLGNYFAIRLR
jgi:hypothetical protein